MLPYTKEDVVAALRGAKNLNAAVKNFLKKETGGDAKLAHFAKELRAGFESRIEGRAESTAARAMVENEGALYAVLKHAYAEGIVANIERIVEVHADKFSATYEPGAKGITVKDRKNFSSIIHQVIGELDTLLAEQQMPVSNLMKNTVLAYLFEPDVLKEVITVLNEAA